MPTQSVEKLLYRDLSKVAAKEVIEVASPLLTDLVNYSTAVYLRCRDSITDQYEKDAAPALYLHVIEMIDGVEVQIAQACSIPAIPTVRSAFEALLSMDYMFKKDYNQRWLSFYVMQKYNTLKDLERFDPSTPIGQKIQTAWASDEVRNRVPQPKTGQHQKAIAVQKRLLSKPEFAPILAEIGKNKRKYQKWYSLFGGPSGLSQLADHLDRKLQYDILYHSWSIIGHAEDVTRFQSKIPKSALRYTELRKPKDIPQIAHLAASIVIQTTFLMLRKFRDGEDRYFSQWLDTEIRSRFDSLFPEIAQVLN